MKKNLTIHQQRLFNAHNQLYSEFPGQTFLSISFAIQKEVNGISKRTEKIITEERAKKDFFDFIYHLNRHEIFYKGYTSFWLLIERNSFERRGVHLHALMDRINSEKIERLNKLCNYCFGESKIKLRDEYTIPYLAEKHIFSKLLYSQPHKINCRYRGKKKEMENEIWFYYRGFYKAYIQDYKIKQKLDDWKDCKIQCSYFMPGGKNGWDYVFPAKKYSRIAKLLNLPLKKKNQNRVFAGKNSKVVKAKKGGDFTQAEF